MSVPILHQKYKYNIDPIKYKDIILCLINKCGGKIEGKKKLAKLLYFLEFDFYEKYEEPLINDVFLKYKMGPYPVNFETIVDELSAENKLRLTNHEIVGFNNPAVHYTSNGEHHHKLLTEEVDMIERIAKLYGTKTGGFLENLSHKEAPWNAVDMNEVINVELALYRGTKF